MANFEFLLWDAGAKKHRPAAPGDVADTNTKTAIVDAIVADPVAQAAIAGAVTDDVVTAIAADPAAQTAIAAAIADDLISKDAGNVVSKGSDSLLFASAATVAAAIVADPAAQASLATAIADDVVTAIAADPAAQTALAASVADDLLSKDAGNAAVLGADKLVYVPAAKSSDLISADAGNIVKTGTDSKLFADASGVVAAIVADPAAQTALGNVMADDVVTAIVALPPQQDALSAALLDDMVADIVGDAASQTALAGALADDLLSKDAGNVAVLGTDKLIYVAPGAAPTIVSADAGNKLTKGSDGGAFYVMPDTDLSNTPSAGDVVVSITTGASTTLPGATAALAGVMTATDKAKLDGIPSSAVPTSRVLTAGAGLTGGGDLSADRSFAVAANGVDNTMLADMAANTIKGAVGAGDPADLTPAQVSTMIMSADGGNAIVAGTDGKLYVAPGATPTIVSKDAGNDVVAGTDGGAYLAETVTSLAYSAATKVLTFKDEAGNSTALDLSALAADIYVNGATFNAGTGILTLTDNDGASPDVVVDLSAYKVGVTDNADGTYTLAQAGNTFTIDTVDALNSLGAGESILGAAAGRTHGIKSLKAVGATLSSDANEITITVAATTVVSADAGNQIVAGADGGAFLTGKVAETRAVNTGTGLTGGGNLSADRTLAVDFPNVISTDASNVITQGTDGKLYVAPGGAPTIVSADAGNDISKGTDGGAFIDGVVFEARVVNTGSGLTGGGDLTADRTFAIDYAGAISSDASNALKVGTDGKFHVTVGAAPVSSVFGRTGAVVAAAGDYTAAQVVNVPAGTLSATDVQAAINEIDGDNVAQDALIAANASAIATKASSAITITGTGALTGGGDLTANRTISLANDGVTNAHLANMPANTIKGNNTGAAADPVDMTAAQTWAVLDTVVYSFNKQKGAALKTLADAASIAWALDDNQVAQVTLAGNRALANPTQMVAGHTYILIVEQDATGSRTLSFGTAYKFPGGKDPVMSTAANAVDIITFVSDGTSMYGVAQKAFA